MTAEAERELARRLRMPPGLLADAWPGLALHPDPEGQRLAALEIIRKLATLGYLPDGVDSPDSLEPD